MSKMTSGTSGGVVTSERPQTLQLVRTDAVPARPTIPCTWQRVPASQRTKVPIGGFPRLAFSPRLRDHDSETAMILRTIDSLAASVTPAALLLTLPIHP
jgi:hypothetical protein